MNVARALAVVALVFVGGLDASAAPAEVADAHKRLATARENLAKAIHRIETDPPSTEDLDAAHAAVGVLKDAIDGGAEHEAKDLDYAKAVLAARKELRTHREYVDQRRAKVHIHNHRRSIDAALSTMNERAARTEGKDATAKDFEEARTAIAGLRKAVDPARQLTKDDEKLATFVTEVDATIARVEKALDDRWTLRNLDKHRSQVDETRKALASSLAALGKGDGSDAEFEAADKAASTLAKLLEEGKVFEPRDKAYRADADRARGDLAQAKKRMSELLSTAVLDRLKGEVAPAHDDLTAALKAIRARKPTADQLAEARTAAIVVRKLVEKLQPQAASSPSFGQYVSEVKKTLVEVEVELQKRTLDAARADVAQALKEIEKRSATDEQFQQLDTALTVLEKTIETVHRKDPAIAPSVADARALIRDARARGAQRRLEVAVQRQRTKLQETRRHTEGVVRQIQAANIDDEQLQAAENAVKLLQATVDEGAALIKKDGDYAKYDREAKDRIRELNERIGNRRVALAARRGRERLTERVGEVKAKLDVAKKPEATDADLEAAGKSLSALMQAIEANAALEKMDKGYALSAERARNELLRHTEALELAKPARALRKQTGEALAAGAALVEAAVGTQDLRKQKEHFAKAVAQFSSCEKDGGAMLQSDPTLAKAKVLVEGQPTPPKEVITLCAERAKASEQQLRQVTALVAFEDSKRAYEKGKSLLGQSKKSEALPQFAECIVLARSANYRYPELKEQKFEVAGAQMSLAQLIDQCVNHRKALLPHQ